MSASDNGVPSARATGAVQLTLILPVAVEVIPLPPDIVEPVLPPEIVEPVLPPEIVSVVDVNEDELPVLTTPLLPPPQAASPSVRASSNEAREITL